MVRGNTYIEFGRGGDRGGSRRPRAPFRRGGGGGRGGPRGGRGGSKVVVEPHRFPGVYIVRGKEDMLATKSLAPGETVYQEKKVTVTDGDLKTEYRVWNPYRSKIAATILGNVEDVGIRPAAKVLYLGAASGTTVSHVADVVGMEGMVYAVEFSERSGRDLVNMAKKRTNVVPIVDDARHPIRYRMLVPMVDVLFADVAQRDQARILALNAQHYLKNGGRFLISIKANCIDSTVEPRVVFEREIETLRELGFTPDEMITLEPYEVDHAAVSGVYRA